MIIGKVKVADHFLKMLWEDNELTLQEFLESKGCTKVFKIKEFDMISLWGISHPDILEDGEEYDALISKGWGSITFKKT